MSDQVVYLSFGEGGVLPIQAETEADAAVPPPREERGTNGSPFGPEGPRPVGRGERANQILGRAGSSIEEALDQIREFGAQSLTRLTDLPRKPDKVTIEVAIKLSAEAGVMVAKAATEANFRVAMEWDSAATPHAEQ
ncbi:CU044_2847 family protein [Streptomyces gelaticus]